MKTEPSKWSAWVVTIAAWMVVGGVAQAQQILADTDCWETEAGTQVALPAFPSGFFGSKFGTSLIAFVAAEKHAENVTANGAFDAGEAIYLDNDASGTVSAGDTLISGPQQGSSDPIAAGTVVPLVGKPLPASVVTNTCQCPPESLVETTWTDPHGNPVSPDSKHKVTPQYVVADIDTCVRRLQDADVSVNGVPDTVDIEIIALSLQSTSPITVTFGAQPSSDFDVFVRESGGVQAPGTMTFTKTGAPPGEITGPVTNDSLPVEFDLTFKDAGAVLPDKVVNALTLDFVDTPGTFTLSLGSPIPALSPWGLVLFGGILMSGMTIIWLSMRRRQRKEC